MSAHPRSKGPFFKPDVKMRGCGWSSGTDVLNSVMSLWNVPDLQQGDDIWASISIREKKTGHGGRPRGNWSSPITIKKPLWNSNLTLTPTIDFLKSSLFTLLNAFCFEFRPVYLVLAAPNSKRLRQCCRSHSRKRWQCITTAKSECAFKFCGERMNNWRHFPISH